MSRTWARRALGEPRLTDPPWRSRVALRELDPVVVDILDRARRSAGLSCFEVARRTGLDRSYVGRLARGQRVPSVEVAARLIDVLGLDDVAAARLLAVARPGSGYSSPFRQGWRPDRAGVSTTVDALDEDAPVFVSDDVLLGVVGGQRSPFLSEAGS